MPSVDLKKKMEEREIELEELRYLNEDEIKYPEKLSIDDECSSEADDERGTWANRGEFLLSIVGYTIGLGSVWRFPIICARNGGGAFLIPFFFFLITCGGPLYYLEVCLGQFSGMSAGLSFEFCPLLRGLGLLQVLLSLTGLWYAFMVFAWVNYYLVCSFFPQLPWSSCNNTWNTPDCKEFYVTVETLDNGTEVVYSSNSTQYSSAAFEFWQYKAIGRSSGLSEMGHIQIHLMLGLLAAIALVIAAVIKGVKSLGKVVYVTATAPYILLIIMFIRGITLDGGIDGIVAFLSPDFGKLFELQVWLEAGVQVFYSLGPTWGGVITMASYNKFHQQSFWLSTICVASSGFTSFFNGMVVYTIIGFMAKEAGMSISEVATQSGPGLAFIAFPTAISRMPLPNLWSVLFFVTLVFVLFDSQFGMFETITSGIVDLFPRKLIPKRLLVNISVAILFFLSQLPLTMNGGIYIFQLADWYFPMFGLLFGSFLEVLAVSWIYGLDRFSEDIRLMMGREVSVVLRCMWGIVIPIFSLTLFIILLSRYSTPAYGDGYVYEAYAIAIGICGGMLPVLGVFVIAAITLYNLKGSLAKRFWTSLRPSSSWVPNSAVERKRYDKNPYVYHNVWWKQVLINLRGK